MQQIFKIFKIFDSTFESFEINQLKWQLFSSIYGHSSPLSMVTIELASLPTERYKRNVIRGKLDLVVSIGGNKFQ